jgi:branched-chain amino acid transport system ATP-binding protein
MTILDVKGLVKSFSGLTAVNDINLEVREHEFLGIVGPNGAGKTTLFSLLSGQLPPSAGRVVFEGRDITGWSANKVAATGLV